MVRLTDVPYPPPYTYTYDSLDQLTRENNQAAGKTWVYTYDNGGNILSKSEYAYTTGALGTALDTISYGYGDSSWKDLLTSYDGQALTTDAIGNLTNDGTWSYSWQHGRQLKQMSRPDASGDTEMIRFRYDSSGHRIGKDSGVYHISYSGGEAVYAGETTRTSYSYLGDTLTQVNIDAPTGSTSLHFTYDEIGPMSVTYNGAEYFYLKNAQGDVTGLVNSSGTQVVAYTYDAWGNPLTTTGTMADTLGKLNPFRYRGYFYDAETGLYYLQSRYYNPETGRFINADSVIAGVGGSVQGYNLFAYCFNSPVNMSDSSGHWPQWIKDAANWVNNNIIQPVKNFFSSLKQGNVVNASSRDANRRPYTGKPGSTYRAPNGDSRTYGPDGTPEHDYDHDDHGRPDKHPHDPNGGHNHDWKNGVRGPAYSIGWEPIAGVALVTVCVIGIVIVAADDATGIGVSDDFLFGPLGAGVREGLILIFG